MIVLDFQYTQQDCIRAWRRHYLEILNLPLDLVVIALLIVLGLWQWRNNENTYGFILLALAAALGLAILCALFVFPFLAYRNDVKRKRAYRLLFSENGIEFSAGTVESKLKWDLYERALVDRDSYLLYYGRSQFTILPKRVFATESSRKDFEDLLAGKIKRIVQR